MADLPYKSYEKQILCQPEWNQGLLAARTGEKAVQRVRTHCICMRAHTHTHFISLPLLRFHPALPTLFHEPVVLFDDRCRSFQHVLKFPQVECVRMKL